MHKFRALLISVVISIAAYGLWVGLSDWQSVKVAISKVGWEGTIFICSLSLINYILRFFRWQMYLKHLGYSDIPILKHLQIYLSGFALTTTPGKAGEAIRSVYLKEHGVDYSSSIAALFAERVSDLLSVLIIALFALSYFTEYQLVAAIFAALIVLSLIFINSPTLMNLLRNLAFKITKGKMQLAIQHLFNVIDQMTQLLGLRILLLGLVMGVISWGAEAYAFSFILDRMHYNIDAQIAGGIYALGMIAGAISLMPGGLGGAEAAMDLLLLAMGVIQSDATAATLVCRITTLWFAVAIGLVALLTLGKGRPSEIQLDPEHP